MPISKLQVIGGAPLTGKTTLAKSIAHSRPVTLLSTDNVRSWMQSVCNPADMPNLFSSHNLRVEQYYQKFPTAGAALEEEIAQSRDVGVGLIELLSIENLPWTEVIVEGIANTPELIVALKEKLPSVEHTATVLYDNDRNRIQRRVYSRGLWAAANTYPDEIKLIEVEWTVLYNEWFREQANKYKLEITPVRGD